MSRLFANLLRCLVWVISVLVLHLINELDIFFFGLLRCGTLIDNFLPGLPLGFAL